MNGTSKSEKEKMRKSKKRKNFLVDCLSPIYLVRKEKEELLQIWPVYIYHTHVVLKRTIISQEEKGETAAHTVSTNSGKF